MEKYYESKEGIIYNGDSMEILKELPDNSIDTIITDPPYELGFMNKKWDRSGITYDIAFWQEALRIAKPGATLLCFGGTRTWHRLACAIEDAGWFIKDTLMWLYGSGFPKATDISKQIDKRAGNIRKIINIKRSGISSRAYQSEKTTTSGIYYETAPITLEAKRWNGWKSHGLKPAYEPIIMAVKRNEGSYADNALKWGVSGLWIDGGRIGTEEISTHGYKGYGSFGVGGKENLGIKEIKPLYQRHKGRFPANLLLDEYAAELLDEQSGGASRFFYVAKASRSERNRGCEGLEEKHYKTNIMPKPGSVAKYGYEKASEIRKTLTNKNNHPTVKSIKLMEYLCRLTMTPSGGVVLDPFLGSGTTAIACVNTGRKFIGIEKETEYCEIAKARIEYAIKTKLPDLFENNENNL